MDKPSVAIVGLLPGQVSRIDAQYGDKLNMCYIDADRSRPKVQATAASSDHVIVMTRFVSHETQAAVRGHSGLIYCNGAESAVKHQPDALLNGQSR